MILSASHPFVTAAILLLAMALGAIIALIAVELRMRRRRTSSVTRLQSSASQLSEAERIRRQDVVGRLMALYSGVHSADALSDFLNGELERRHEVWRVRVPVDGPGEIYDLDPV